jgi:hypothetical protein
MLKKLLLVALAAMMLGTIAAAQSDPGYYTNDVYWVSYFANRNNPTGADQFVYIINPGYTGTPLSSNEGTLCANIYVFDAVQELVECCACPITANALLALSVDNSLTANPLTSVAPASGVIKLVSTSPTGTSCDPTKAGQLSPDFRAWATHLQQPTSGTFVTTEAPFLAAPLATGGTSVEEGFLPQACTFAQYMGSGKAVCACK